MEEPDVCMQISRAKINEASTNVEGSLILHAPNTPGRIFFKRLSLFPFPFTKSILLF